MKRSRELGMQTLTKPYSIYTKAKQITYKDALKHADSQTTCVTNQVV